VAVLIVARRVFGKQIEPSLKNVAEKSVMAAAMDVSIEAYGNRQSACGTLKAGEVGKPFEMIAVDQRIDRRMLALRIPRAGYCELFGFFREATELGTLRLRIGLRIPAVFVIAPDGLGSEGNTEFFKYLRCPRE